MSNVVKAMNAEGVRRFIGLSAWGAGDSAGQSSLPFKLARNTLLKYVYDDKNRGEAQIIDSDLDYTLVRPGRLTNGPAKGGVRASLVGKGLSRAIAREDVGAFMVEQLGDPTWTRKSPLIGY